MILGLVAVAPHLKERDIDDVIIDPRIPPAFVPPFLFGYLA
jgi:hypothetical protein